MWPQRVKLKLFSSIAIVLLLLNCASPVVGKKYLRCELSRELVEKYKINKTFLSNWICLIEHESDRDTKKVTRLGNGENKFGIFQISSKECDAGNGKVTACDTQKYPCCKVKCENFLNDDISDDVQCAQRIFDLKGFQNWNGWSSFCRNTQNLPNLSVTCNINTVTPLSRLTSYISPNFRF
ncbi:lysozyme c-1 [Stomoxys calcitrans]|uniref:lysozyme n=1 Tax=Stomoxys calcitrans TaxID=35570 RepID=A0A1I8PTM2_STOCA|nr:lysozyme c-1 [Stomoxys calcitrans]XP_013111754.1 lysozyme c-1 [Stomoxys calcitrans]XP_013111755.1 lysozyme c-1 [Stomoxys calcitrans]XP_013111756.1 lysozyme c-1 [Stomoxys calcitrans]XP_013111757.1 lysozyme c-1 [Stomoxys calcitrans]XP_013111758.1 lysozyme c-1 [Stomoxys calcitrans]